MSDSPIFIVGANRSGTTLLRLMLNAHSRIAVPDEMRFFRFTPAAGISIFDWAQPDVSDAKWDEFVNGFLDVNAGHLAELDGDAIREELMALDPRELRTPFTLVMETWAKHFGKMRWGEKTPGTLYYCDVAIEMFPSAKFIYIARDPRGGVTSMQKTSFYTDNVILNSFIRNKSHSIGRKVLLEHVPVDQRIDVRYEDLVTQSESQLKSICEFLGEEYESEMLAFFENSKRFMIDKASDDFNRAAKMPVDRTKAESWKNELSPYDAAIVEKICSAEMEEFGYVKLGKRLSLSQTIRIKLHRAYWDYYVRRNDTVREYSVMWDVPFRRSRREKSGKA